MDENEDDREVAIGEPSAEVAQREADVGRREAALADRLAAAHDVLAAADLRDVDADERDDDALERDRAADLAALLARNGEPYGQDNPRRRLAAMDRLHARDDRSSAADDRHTLTERPDTEQVETSED